MNRFILFLTASLALFAKADDVVVEKGPHHDVHEVVVTEGEGENARIITNRFSVLQTGLNYLESNTWKSATTTIDLADSGAKFERGPYKVKFGANYNAGPLELTLTDGRVLKVQTLGLALTDASSGESFWLAEARDTDGFLEEGGASVVYPDAFDGVKADIVMRVGVGRFESDVVLREQLLDPRVLNWDPANVKLEIWHRLVDPPEGLAKTSYIPRADGTSDLDQQLDFGDMMVGQGLAFLVGTNQAPVADANGRLAVAKEIFHDQPDNSTYLIESIPLGEAQEHLSTLPARREARIDSDKLLKRFEAASAIVKTGGNAGTRERKMPLSVASLDDGRKGSPRKEAKAEAQKTSGRKLAKLDGKSLGTKPGFVMDYTILSAATNFVFKGNSTFLVTNSVSLNGTTVIEPGAVVKFKSGTTPVVRIEGALDCRTSDYAPAIFTASDDNSVGETISGSSGNPSGFYGDLHLYITTSNTNKISLHDIHSRYGRIPFGIYTSAATNEVWNLQALFCRHAVVGYGNMIVIHNLLVEQGVSAMDAGKENTVFVAEHVTAHKVGKLFDLDSTTNSQATVNNSLVVIATNASTRVTYDSATQTLTSDTGVFQTNKAGTHYLAKSSPFRAAGTTAVSAVMTNILKMATVYPPLELISDFTANTTLAPRIPRGNSGGKRALGYHYPALDYLWMKQTVTGATLTLTNGVAVAFYGSEGIKLATGGTLVSQGRPEKLNWLVTYNAVQEQPSRFITNGFTFLDGYAATLRFTSVFAPEMLLGPAGFVLGGSYTGTLSARDCEFRNIIWSVQDDMVSGLTPSIDVKNNLFERCSLDWEQGNDAGNPGYFSLTCENNLFARTVLGINHWGNSLGDYSVFNNLFDNSTLTFQELDPMPPHYGGTLASGGFTGFNAYSGTNAVFGGSSNLLSVAASYVDGPLGRFYYPTNGSSLTNLFDAGSKTNAGLVGLYHYSTRNDGSFEAATRLDIGHHYAVVNSNGTAVDSDGDGLANIDEDLNGNGLLDTGETSFADFDTDQDGMSDAVEKTKGFDPRNGTSTILRRLATWDFRTSDLKADTGQIVQTDTNIVRDTNAFSIYAVSLTSTNSSLSYNEIEDIDHPNISRGLGAVSLWFRPNWSTSTNTDVFSASLPGHLLCLGQSSGNKDNFWALRFTPKGDKLIFETQAGEVAVTNLTASINWTNGGWYHVLLAYSSSGSWLYLNGDTNSASVVSSAVAPLVPASWNRLNGKLYFGCYSAGAGVAKGALDEVHTFNYVPGLEAIQAEYPGALLEDADHDGLSTLEEIALHTNPFNRDTDGDGMPDGWEVHAVRMAPGTSFTLLDPLVKDGDGNSDGDDLSNLEEYLRGTNPYGTNSLPEPTQAHRPAASTNLFNLDFGTGTTATGLAAAGISTNDSWTKIGPRFSGTVNSVGGDGASINVYLQQTLGTVIKNLLPCPSTYITNVGYVTNITIAVPTNPFCEGMNRTNLFGNVECCVPSSGIPPNLYWQPWQPWINRVAWWNQRVSLFRRFDQWAYLRNYQVASTYLPYLYISSPAIESNICVTSSGFLNYGRVGINAESGQGGVFSPPLWASSELYNLFWGTSRIETFTVTNYVATTATAWIYPDDYPQDQRGSQSVTTPLIIGTAQGWTQGFDVPRISSATYAAPDVTMIRDYLTCSFDYSIASLPISSGCNSYQYLRDGSARILITDVSGWYRVYLYSFADNAYKLEQIDVNGSPARTPFFSTAFNGYTLGSYSGSTVHDSGGMITLAFPTNQTAISGLQLMKLEKLVPPGNIQIETNEVYGAMIKFDPVPTATWFEVRRHDMSTGEETTWLTSENRFTDPSIPRGVEVRYSIRSGNEVPELISDWSSEVTVSAQPAVQLVNHAPTIRGEIRLSGAYMNSPFNIGAGGIIAGADAFDIDGNALSFCISGLAEGTLKLKNLGTNTFLTITTNHVAATSTNLLIIGGETTLSWTPPADVSDNWVTAFYVQAYDGEFRSFAAVPVRIYVKGPTILNSWGSMQSNLGDGSETGSVNVSDPDFTVNMRGKYWRSEPSPVLQDGTEAMSLSAQLLTNIVQVVGNGREFLAALRSDGTVWTWGYGFWGNLGDSTNYGGTNGLFSWFTYKRLKAAVVPDLDQVVSIAAGSAHILAVRADGTVWGWGDCGSLGLGAQGLHYMTRSYYTNGYDTNMTASLGEASSVPLRLDGLQNAISVVSSGNLNAILTQNGDVYWWGGFNGDEPAETPQLLKFPGRVTQIAVGADEFILALNDSGEVYGWGWNTDGQLGNGMKGGFVGIPARVPLLSPVRSISASGTTSTAVTTAGQVFQWGYIDEPRFDKFVRAGHRALSPERKAGLQNVVQFASSRGSNFAETSDQSFYGWGYEDWGVLGIDWDPLLQDQLYFVSSPLALDTLEGGQSIWPVGEAAFGSFRADRMTPHGLRSVCLSGEVDLSWKTYAGATAYELQRSVENNNEVSFHTIAIVPQNPTAARQAYVDRNVTNGVSYLYRVSAISDSGSTFFCDPILAIPVPPPGPVESIEAIALSRQIRVRWSRAMPTHDYALYRSVNGGPFALFQSIFDGGMGYGSFVDDPQHINLVDYSVAATNTYTYRVQATNMAGFGPMSTNTAAVSPTEDTLYPVSNVGVDISASGQATVTWDPLDGWSGTYWVRAYELSGTNITRTVGELQITAGTNAFFTGLRAGKTNIFIVSSVREEDGESDPTSVQAAWWPPYLSTTPVQFITAKSGPGFVYFRWRGDAAYYGITASPSTNIPCVYNFADPDVSGVAEYFAALPANTYTFTFEQFYDDSGGVGSTNKTLAVTSGTFTNLPALNVVAANNRASITWYGSLADYGTNTTLYRDWRFVLQRKEDANPAPYCPGYWTIYDSNDLGKNSTATMGVVDEEVQNGHSYRYRLYAISPEFDVVMEDSASTITPYETFPSTNVLTVAVTNYSGGVGLGWNALTNANGYRVESSPVKGGPYAAIGTTASSVNSFVDRGLDNGQLIYYIVTATNVNGDTLPSTEVVGLPSETGGLLKPYGFMADLHNQLLFLDWKLVTGADSYSVWQSTNRLWQGVLPEFAAAYISTNSQYRYTVQAQRRGTTSSQDVTVETIAWTPVTDALLYRIDIVENSLTNFVGTSETPDFENVRLGTFTNLGSYIITAFDSGGSSISTNTSVSMRGSVAPVLLDRNQATISLTGLGTATNNALAINSPTNFWLCSLVVNKSPDTRTVTRVEYFMDGGYLGASTDWPYSWQWVNPAGSPTGTVHAVVARLVTSDNKSVDSAAGYISVIARPELSAYTTSATDLQFPTPGLPLALSRYYDSRDTVGGILGKGWKLDWERSSITVPDLSQNWVKTKFNALATQVYAEAQLHPIYVDISGGREVFHPVAAGGFFEDDDFPDMGWDFPLAFSPVDLFAMGRLETANGVADMVAIRENYDGKPEDLKVQGNLETSYAPSDLAYISGDGGRLVFSTAMSSPDRVYALTSVSDRYSNSVTYACGTTNILLQHSNGRQIQLIQTNTLWSVFDPAELAVTNPANRVPVLRYVVTGGFLTEVQTIHDRSAKTYDTNYYSYDASGRLAVLAGPDGVVKLVNTYDTNSFVVSQGDAVGLDATLGYATVNGSLQLQVTQNGSNGTTRVARFGPGGELSSVQPDTAHSNVVAQVGYTAQGLPAFQLQTDGTNVAYTSFAYDVNGRPIEQVDALGNKTTTEYAAFGPSYVSDALQNGTSYDYYKPSGVVATSINQEVDPEGSLRTVTDASGMITSYTYNGLGQPLTETRTSPFGGIPHITKYEYFDNGDLKRTSELIFKSGTNEVYVATDYTYDVNGNRVSETRVRHTLARSGGAAVLDTNSVPTLTLETNVTTFSYDSRNRLVTTANPLGETSGSLYNANGRVNTSTNTFGQITSYVYDVRGNLLETAYPDGTVSRSVYDDHGRVSWTQERATPNVTNSVTVAPATETQYDTLGRTHLVYRHENTALQRVTLSSSDWTNTFTPGTYYRKVSGVTLSTQYTMTVVTNGTVASTTRTEYDPLGRVQYSVNALGGVTAFGYDAVGRRVATTNWSGYYLSNIATNTIDPGTNAFTFTTVGYDGNGNQISATDGNGNTTSFFYDALNRRVATQFPLVSGDDTRKTQWTVYDGLGRRRAEVDEIGTWTAFEYDLLGRLVTVTNDYRTTYPTNLVPSITRYAYDEFGNMTNEVRSLWSVLSGGSITNDPSQDRVTWFEYDQLGRRIYRFFPTIPASLDDATNNVAMEKVTFSRMTNGGIVTLRKVLRDPRGVTITNDFDIMDRLVTKTLSPVNTNQVLRTVSYDYTGALLAKVRENGTGIARTNYYTYDDSRRLKRKDTPEGVLTYTYRANSAVGAMKAYGRPAVSVNADPGSATQDLSLGYGYDALGRLSTVTNFFSGPDVSKYYYDSAGNTLSVVYPQTSRMTNTYDARNRLTTVEIGKTDGSLIRRFESAFTANSLRTGVTEKNPGYGGSAVQRRKVNYSYDVGVAEGDVTMTPVRLNRLTHENIIEGSGTDATGSESHLYDGLGNRRKFAASGVSNVVTKNFEFNVLDQMTATNYVFDAAGNIIASPGNGVSNPDSYDAENRLIQRVTWTNTITMGYDADGNRVSKDVYASGSHLTTYYLVDTLNPTGHPQVVAEYTSTVQAPAYSQIYLTFEYGQQLISFRQPVYNATNGAYIGSYVRHQGMDAHGSMRLLLASTGNLDTGCEYDYDAYGSMINTAVTTLDVQMRHAGEMWDQELGMYYNRSRFYNPTIGRFWNKDSYEGDPSNPTSLHKYLYCAADPVNNVDPSGHDPNFTAAGQTAISGIQFNSRTLEGVAVAEFQRRAVQTLIFKVGAYAISGTAITTGIIAPAAIVISEAQRSAAMSRLKADVEREKQKRGGEILFHYTDWDSAVQIAMAGVIYASERYSSGNFTFPPGAYATDVPPWSMEYTQSQLSALFYGGVEHHPVGAFVAIEQNDFYGPLEYKGFPHQYVRPAAAGTPVPVRVVTHGPNLMR